MIIIITINLFDKMKTKQRRYEVSFLFHIPHRMKTSFNDKNANGDQQQTADYILKVLHCELYSQKN